MSTSSADSTPAQIYRFGNVSLDAQSFQLSVRGLVQTCPPRPLRLLLLLCRAPGQVFSRDELIQALWPGRREVSDESLSQIIFKLRSVLGEDAEPIVTVRSVGLRLDALVSVDTRAVAAPGLSSTTAAVESEGASAITAPLPDADEAASDYAASLPHTPRAPPPAPRRWQLLLVASLLAALALLGLLWWQYQRDLQWAIAAGWGLSAEQMHASAAASAPLLQQALRVDAAGDRARAQILLVSIHDSDSSTPLPALLLTLWHASSGDRDQAQRWLAHAAPRATRSADALISAYYQMAATFVEGQGTAILASLSAMLERRPDAWILRYGRAQLLLQRGQRAAALEDLQRIPVPRLDDHRLEDVLADRAALGDLAGAQAVLQQLSHDDNRVGRQAVAARLAYSAGAISEARNGFAQTAELAARHGRSDWVLRGQMLSAALAIEMGDFDDARRRLLEAQALARDARETLSSLDTCLMLAQLAELRSNTRERDEAIARAVEETERIGDPVWNTMVQLVALRTGASLPAMPSREDTDLAARGLLQLLAARHAWASGDRDAAATRLAEAVDAGIANSIAAEEAQLLAQSLGQAWTLPPRRDPPSRPYFLLVSRSVLARTHTASPHAGTTP